MCRLLAALCVLMLLFAAGAGARTTPARQAAPGPMALGNSARLGSAAIAPTLSGGETIAFLKSASGSQDYSLVTAIGLGGDRGEQVLSMTGRVGAGPVALPGGQVLYASATPRSKHWDVLIASWNGAQVQRRVVARDLGYVDCSLDGRTLLLEQATGSREMLVVVSVADGSVRRLPATLSTSLEGASFSPDAQRIVYAAEPPARKNRGWENSGDLHIIDVNTGRSKAVTHNLLSVDPVWGRAGIAYARGFRDGRYGQRSRINLLRPDGSVKALTPLSDRLPETAYVTWFRPVMWSGDGRRLVANEAGQFGIDAWTIDLDRGTARDLTGVPDDVVASGISRDGRTVLAEPELNELTRHPSIFTIPFAGGRRTTVASDAILGNWAW